MASLLLAALWGLSVFAGWGLDAFCSDGACADRLGGFVRVSGLFAVVAACCTAGAWLAPAARRDEGRFMALMSVAVAAWVIAEGVVFVGGMIVR
ncbi:hypothetical protein [Streptosporangium sp. NPDC000396]|uniref:hypothetical protein n=1 Tax=Streptosporangium sp. NPDC000396 TaxID=3366185 RepID=UPI0036B0DB18